MIKDAEAHAEEDRRKREEAETRNTADSLAWQTENLLKEQGDKVPADDRAKIEEALKALKDALAGPDIDAVKRAHEALLSGEPGVHAAAVPERAGAAVGDAAAAPAPVTRSRPTTRSPTPRSSTTTSRARNP